MSSLNDLPVDLKQRVSYYLHPLDACALRLVCKDWLYFVTEQAFSVLVLRNDESNTRFTKVLEAGHLGEHVRHIVYRAGTF